ncbi:MAG: hypothetical protein GY855_06910, partial [candidate division Zixibacteria bacterium]|nr:hypothetical protein [candidate division Zixibacteria bacterium]
MLIDRKIFSAISFVIAIVITSLSWAYELKEVIISGDNSSGPYRISSKPVVVSSDSIWIDGDLQSQPENYFFDYSRGFISFNMPVSDSSSIRAQFIPIYFKFTNPYFIYKPESINLKSAFQPDSTKIPSYSDRQTAKYEPGMNIGGSKSFSFEIGSAQDPDISQALDLTIRGPVVKGVNATAFVSDKGTPALAEGTSSTIDEIDKFFINISAKNFSATLGDYYTDFNDLKLARYSKKLKGVSLNYDDNVNYAYLSGASSSGRLTINRFVGNEGNQGPYFLTDPSGSRGFIILPGTETVYIDGEVLVRGSDNDYIIDYQNAHVTFTPKMLITSDSRIEVEFEYSSREFSRSFYTSRVQRNSKNGIYSFGATVIAEADDKSRPLNTTLSDDDKQTIKNAGSNDYALKSGVEFVGSGKGEYNRLTDSTGYQYYQYIAPDSGEYRVSFSNLGSGNGEYIYIGRGVYEFVGVSNGDYSPVIKLPIPKSQYLYGFDGRISPSENIIFQVETAYSRENKNRFLRSEAMYDDPALTINSELKSKFSKGYLPDIVEIKAYYRHSAKYFKPFAEFRGSDYYNRWNLPIDYVESDEDVGEGQISIDYNAKYKINFGGGRLSRASQGESNRWNASSSLDFPFDLRLITTISEAKYETENDSLTAGLGDKNRLRESSSQIEYSLWIFKPSIGYRYRYDASYNDNILKRGEKYNIYIGG